MPRFPRSVAAHRWQMWLLVTALFAIVVTGFLIVDLTRNLRTVVISDTNKALTNAVQELQQFRLRAHLSPDESSQRDRADADLRKISYEVLSSYPDVEGGYLLDDKVIGHSFPTYTEPGSTLYQPVLEHEEVLSALAESRRTGRVARRVVQDRRDLVLVAVLAPKDTLLPAWALRRILNFSDSSELNKRSLLVIFMLVSLVSIGIVIRLSWDFSVSSPSFGQGWRDCERILAIGFRITAGNFAAWSRRSTAWRRVDRKWKLRYGEKTGFG